MQIDVDVDVDDDFVVVDDFVEQCSLNKIVINIDNSRSLRLFNSILFHLMVIIMGLQKLDVCLLDYRLDVHCALCIGL